MLVRQHCAGIAEEAFSSIKHHTDPGGGEGEMQVMQVMQRGASQSKGLDLHRMPGRTQT